MAEKSALLKYLELKEREEKSPLIRFMDSQKERGQLLSSADMKEDRKIRDIRYESMKETVTPEESADRVKSVSFARIPQQTASQQFINRNDVNGKKILAVPQNNREALAKNIAESDLASYRKKEAELEAERQRIEAARPVSKVQEDLNDIDKNIKKAKKDALLGEFSMLAGNPYPREQATERLNWLEGERDKYADELEFSRYAEYEKLKKSDDYEVKSKYSTTAKSSGNKQAVASLSDYGDWRYEYINQNPAVVAAVESGGTDVSYLKEMSDDEVGLYNYLYKTNGKEAAEDYIDSLQDELYIRKREQSEAKYSEFAKEHPVLASAASVPMNMFKGIAYAAQAADDLFTGEADPNAPYNAAVYNTNAIRSSVSDLAEEKWGKPGSFAYGLAMSMADFLAANAISGGTGAAKLILGSGAAADTTISAIERGVDSNAAVVLGATAGVIEALTEEASIEALFKGDWTKKAIKHIFKNIVTEGSEEGASTILNTLADILISGDKSEWEISVAAYMDDGYSEKDAFKNTFLDKLKEIGLDVLGGAISGGLMSGGFVAIDQTGKAAARADEKYSQFETLREAVKQDNARREFEFAQDGVEKEGFVLPTAEDTAKSAEAEVESDLDAGLKEDTVPRAKTYEETVLEKKIAKATTTAERSGLRLGVNESDIETAKSLGLRTGRNVVFYSDASEAGKSKDGYINRGNNTIYVNKDAGARKATAQVLGHELTHSTEGTEAYDLLEQKALESLIRKGVNPDTERERIKQLYERAGIDLATDEQVDGEIVAKYVEENLINNRAAVRELVRENPSAARKFKMSLAKMLTKVTGNENYIDYKTITSMQKMIDDAAKETAKAAETEVPVAEVQPVASETVETEARTEAPVSQTAAAETIAKETTAEESPGTKTESIKKPTFETAAAEETEQNTKSKADEPMPSGADEYLADVLARYEAGELSEEEYEEAYSVYEEMRDTGVPFDKSSIMVEYVEGKSPGAIRKAVEIVTGGKRSANQMQEVRADAESGKPVSGTDEVANSIAYDEEYMKAAEEMNRELKKVPVNVMANAQRARAVIREIFTNPKLKDALNLPPENIGNTYIPNGAYDGTEENTTVCIRSLAADALMDAVAEHLGRPLTVEDTMIVSQEYWQYTDQPECLYCYVAMDRKAYREYLGSYLQQRSDVLKNIHDGMDTEEAYKIFLDGRKPTTQMRGRFDSWVKYDRDGSAMITAADLASDKAMNAAIARDSSLLEQINDARKYAQGASWAKKRIGYTAYNNHILKWTDDRVRKLNSQYGLRMYSFSDFSPAFILENMQMITDAAVRGLKMLGYTKDLNFVRIFAPSGININISTFAYEQNGEFVQDGMQGADWAEAQKLRDQYGNVGITFVAVNDAQVEWAMAQDWVDTVIPFHLVRTGSKVAEHFGWTNYTQMSSDVKGEGWKKGGKKSVFPSEHQNDFDKYMAALEKHHLEPRFAKWVDNPNYMKLVNETRLSAGETKPVRPRFDVDAAKAAIDEMIKRGGYYTPIGKTDENMREIAGEIADKIRADEGVQWSVSDEAYLEAVDRGDMETAQRMVDEAAKEAGFEVDAYHGTDNGDFTVFDWDKTQSTDGGFFGRGHYFTKFDGVAKQYGSRVIPAKLKLRKTFVWSKEINSYNGKRPPEVLSRNVVSRINMARIFPELFANKKMYYYTFDNNAGDYVEKSIAWRDLENIIKKAEKELILREYGDGTFRWHTEGKFWEVPVGESYSSKREAENGRFFAAINALPEKYEGLLNGMTLDDQTTYTQGYGAEITEILKNNGYDSAMDTSEGGEIVVFDSSQIKSADPVTYDDNGNVIPISERFKGDSPDIRYSVSEDESSAESPKSLQDMVPTQAMTRLKRAEYAFAESMRELFELSTEGYYTEFLQTVHAISKDVILNGGNPEAAIDKLFADFNTATEAAMEAWQYSQFDRSAQQYLNQLNTIKRFSDSRAKAATPEKARQNYTAEDAEKMFNARRDAQKNLDRVKARALLTEEDKLIIGQIKRGERSIDQLSPAEYNIEDIRAVAEAEMAFDEADKLISIYKKQIKAGYLSEAEDALKNIKTWKDKATLAYLRETIDRNFRDIIPDKTEAAAFEKQYIKPVHKAEADKQRALSDYRERVKALNLKEKPADGEFVSESYAVQLLGEAEDNIRILEKMRNPETKRDGKTLEEWKSAVELLWADNPSLDQPKIRNAVESFRQIYNELLKQMNQVLLENGYPPVRYRSGYFPHFTVGSEDAVMAKFSRLFGIKLEVNPLPTSISGLTQDFKPGKSWFGHALERTGFETTYDAVAGFEQYIGGALDVIYHTRNIQRFRALASQIRWLSADEGIKKQHQDIVNDDTLTEEQQENLIRDLYAKGRYRMSNLVQYLDEYTNRLANKKMRLDRSMEELFGRKFYTVMQGLESRVAANMIGANFGSALTNIIPLNQAGAIIGNRYVLRGLWDTVQNVKNKDGFAAMSDFLVSRRGSDALGRTGMQKFSDITGIPTQFIDDVVSEAVVRAAYYKNLKNGMSEETALENADAMAASIMADRSKGALPLLFDVKNPAAKLFTQFQVEVNNEFSLIFKDIPEEAKEKGLAMVAAMILKYFIGARIFNDLYEKVMGRRPALDPLEMLNDAVGSLTGYRLPNVLNLLDRESWTTEKMNPADTVAELGTNAAESLPFVGGVLGGGRIPIQSALPDLNNLLNAAANSEWSTERRLSTLGKELIKPAAYLLPPAGGGTAKKLLETAMAAARGGVYGVSDTTLDDGTVVGEETLKYPFYTDSAVEMAVNFARSIMGGTSTTSGGVDWVESGFKGITASETKVYKEMLENGTNQHDAWDAIQRVKNIPKGGVSPTAEKCKAIADSGLNYRSALALYNNKVSDKHGDAIARVMSKGISFDDYLLARAKYAELDYDENLSLFEKTVKMRNWAVQKFPSSKEKQNVIEDVFEFKQVFMSGASDTSIVKNYRGMLESGISESTAIDIANAVASLEPLEGKTTVSAAQKARAVLNTVEDDGYREAALQTVLGNNYKKYGIAHDLGVGFDAYTAFREVLPSYDEDGNASYTNAEVSRAIDAVSGIMSPEQMIMMLMSGQSLPESYALTNDQKAVMWQLATGSTSAKNNPYSTSTGNTVLKMLGKAE